MGTVDPNPHPENFCSANDPRSIATPGQNDFDEVSRMDFEGRSADDLLSHWKLSYSEREDTFTIVNDPAANPKLLRRGKAVNQVARFEVQKGDYAGSFDRKTNDDGIATSRSEIRERFDAKMGKTYWYSFRTFIPEDFPVEDNRLMIAQWHASDSEGEATSPPLAVYYRNGALLIRARYSDKEYISPNEETEKVNLYREEGFPKGQWHQFIFQVKWSYESDGFVNAWVDGRQVVAYTGGVSYKDEDGPYFKFGAYRDEEFIVDDGKETRAKKAATDPYTIYHDDYRRGKNCTDILD